MTLHRSDASQDWRAVEIICALPMGRFLVEERDRPLPGRFSVLRTDLREVVGIFEYGEAFVSKSATCLRDFVAPGRTLADRSAG